MNTEKLFDVDTNKCWEKCGDTCEREDFHLSNFCADVTDNECKKERDYCSCWRLVRISFRVTMIISLGLG